VWTAATNKNGTLGGYGIMNIDQVIHYAHRMSWEFAFGAIPDELLVLHKCDNKPCVNHSHLFLGTQKENLADMKAKGRQNHVRLIGYLNGNAKLTPEQVKRIREIYSVGGITTYQLAPLFGVSKSLIANVVRGQHWAVAS
jgi:hypothetical protein